MKIKVGDNVKVITGSNKGKEGKVLKIFRSELILLKNMLNQIVKMKLVVFLK